MTPFTWPKSVPTALSAQGFLAELWDLAAYRVRQDDAAVEKAVRTHLGHPGLTLTPLSGRHPAGAFVPWTRSTGLRRSYLQANPNLPVIVRATPFGRLGKSHLSGDGAATGWDPNHDDETASAGFTALHPDAALRDSRPVVGVVDLDATGNGLWPEMPGGTHALAAAVLSCRTAADALDRRGARSPARVGNAMRAEAETYRAYANRAEGLVEFSAQEWLKDLRSVALDMRPPNAETEPPAPSYQVVRLRPETVAT